jgi:hypothetical protein
MHGKTNPKTKGEKYISSVTFYPPKSTCKDNMNNKDDRPPGLGPPVDKKDLLPEQECQSFLSSFEELEKAFAATSNGDPQSLDIETGQDTQHTAIPRSQTDEPPDGPANTVTSMSKDIFKPLLDLWACIDPDTRNRFVHFLEKDFDEEDRDYLDLLQGIARAVKSDEKCFEINDRRYYCGTC